MNFDFCRSCSHKKCTPFGRLSWIFGRNAGPVAQAFRPISSSAGGEIVTSVDAGHQDLGSPTLSTTGPCLVGHQTEQTKNRKPETIYQPRLPIQHPQSSPPQHPAPPIARRRIGGETPEERLSTLSPHGYSRQTLPGASVIAVALV
jgi:hypothetical protein